MKLSMLRGTCSDGRTCPNINTTDRDTLVIQGYPATPAQVREVGLDIQSGELAVWIPLALLPEASTETAPRPGLRLTGNETVVIVGAEVSDPEALAELCLPIGEAAVEVTIGALPPLRIAVSHAG